MPSKFMKDYSRAALVMADNVKPWQGGVVRRDPATYQAASRIEFWRCENPACGEFTPEGSRAAGRCVLCQTPMPDWARDGRAAFRPTFALE